MIEIEVNKDDTVALEATLPTDDRDFTGASVTFEIDGNEYSAVFKDESTGDVAIPLSTVDPEPGSHNINWKVEYSDGTIEVIPPQFDRLYVHE